MGLVGVMEGLAERGGRRNGGMCGGINVGLYNEWNDLQGVYSLRHSLTCPLLAPQGDTVITYLRRNHLMTDCRSHQVQVASGQVAASEKEVYGGPASERGHRDGGLQDRQGDGWMDGWTDGWRTEKTAMDT